jgi:hypothetical protein
MCNTEPRLVWCPCLSPSYTHAHSRTYHIRARKHTFTHIPHTHTYHTRARTHTFKHIPHTHTFTHIPHTFTHTPHTHTFTHTPHTNTFSHIPHIHIFTHVGSDSVVGIATRYGMDGPRIETRWGGIFRTCPDRPWGPPSLLYNGYRVSFPGVKRPGRPLTTNPYPAPRLKKE